MSWGKLRHFHMIRILIIPPFLVHFIFATKLENDGLQGGRVESLEELDGILFHEQAAVSHHPDRVGLLRFINVVLKPETEVNQSVNKHKLYFILKKTVKLFYRCDQDGCPALGREVDQMFPNTFPQKGIHAHRLEKKITFKLS